MYTIVNKSNIADQRLTATAPADSYVQKDL